MAKEWSVPPWEIEEKLSARWLRNWMEMREAKSIENDRLNKKQEKKYGTK